MTSTLPRSAKSGSVTLLITMYVIETAHGQQRPRSGCAHVHILIWDLAVREINKVPFPLQMCVCVCHREEI